MDSTLENVKSFWDRTEGKVGKAVIAALAAGVGLFLWNYSSQLVLMLQNTLQAMLLLGTIGTMAALATSREVQNLISALFKVVMYNLTNAIVAIDPIAQMKGQVQKAKVIRSAMEDALGDFRSQIKALQLAIRQNEGRIKMAEAYLIEASRQTKNATAEELNTPEGRAKRKARILNARTASRKQESNKTFQDLLALAQRMLNQLERAKDSADILIEDKQAEIEEREQRSKMSKSVIGVIKKIKQLRGSLQDNELYDMALERENQQFAEAVGRLENFTEVSADFLATSDLANGIFEADAMRRVEELQRSVDSVDGIILTDGAPAQAGRTHGESKVKTGTGSGYSDLF